MDHRAGSAAERAHSFGHFRLLPAQRLLLEGDTPVRLGSRALEILIALVERSGELVSKSELMARVWPDTVVEESNLRVHIAALRRILGDGQPGHRYLAAVPGRGYRFVAPVALAVPAARQPPRAERTHNLPSSQTRTIGRAETIAALLEQLPRRRLVTVVGPGGIGKTTVALSLAESVMSSYEHGVRFVDLAPLGDPHFVPSALASALGIPVHSENAIPDLIRYLQDKQILIVLDSCEHVAEAAASLAEKILKGVPATHVLATSREPLRAEGERVFRLPPLDIPPSSATLTASEALEFPSVQLFVERAAASLDGFELSDADAPIVAEICRKLDGIALAIELAATRIEVFGIRQLFALLEDRLRVLKQGRRTALPRHQTLAATLDWSYGFLPDHERIVFCRLSAFAGSFTLDSASAIAAGGSVNDADAVQAVASLVAKSLVSADVGNSVVYYRLLETTRAYARQKLSESGEADEVTKRHAAYHRDLLQRAEAELEARHTAEWLADYGRRIDDIRSALKWAFCPTGDRSIGVALTVASIPLWMCLSLLDECRAFVEQALAGAEMEPDRNEREEMKLHIALATALLQSKGPRPETEAAWMKALHVAENLADDEYELRANLGLSICRIQNGDYRGALARAQTFCAVADRKGDAAARLIGDRMIGTTSHYLGDHANARRHLDRMLSQYVSPIYWPHIARFQFDHRASARITLSNVLWELGFPDQAVRSAQEILEDVQHTGHALSLCNALAHAACPISLYVGDWAEAERCVALLLEHSAKHALGTWNALGRCFQGALLIKRGDLSGLPLMHDALRELREAGYRVRYPAFLSFLARGLGAAGRMEEAHAAIDEALDLSGRNEERWCIAELLRVKGELLQQEESPAALAAAEDHYQQAIDWARRQGALSWELRAAISLARLWQGRGKTTEAEQLLSSIHDRFTEGFETKDLADARILLERLRTPPP